ncbi:MAG: DUF58 domain-containing protein [Planctomycetota bacterium]|nr:DUF58 domain-containing protein [Planctomycetota bacterium]
MAATVTGADRFSRKTLDGDTRFLDPQVIARIGNIELVARFIVEGFLIGLHKSPYHGFSSEFSSYRKYVKGDAFRFIDWKVAAKTDRLYIKQFEDQTNTRTYVLVDGSASMRFGGDAARVDGSKSRGVPKWRYARDLAAAFAYLMINQGDAAGLAIFRDGPPEVVPTRGGNVHLHALLSVLGKSEPDSGTDTEKGLGALPERLARRGLVVLISDLLDDTARIINGLKGFRARRHEMIVFHLLAPEEREFPYRENIEFVDAETGQTLVAQGSYIGPAYQRALQEHVETIKRYCRAQDIDFVPLTTDELLSTALIAYLNKRQRMM